MDKIAKVFTEGDFHHRTNHAIAEPFYNMKPTYAYGNFTLENNFTCSEELDLKKEDHWSAFNQIFPSNTELEGTTLLIYLIKENSDEELTELYWKVDVLI